MLTFICYPKCTTCKKAQALLDNHHVQYETRDIKADNPSYEELKNWLALSKLPVKKLFNTSGQLYKSLGLKNKLPSMSEDECLKLLATDGMLVKRPLLVDEYRALVGFNLSEWEAVLNPPALYRNKDHEVFWSKGIGDNYEKLGNRNLFMQCHYLRPNAFSSLPTGYSSRLCRRDELEIWKSVVADEQYVDYVTNYYNEVYAKNEDEFFKRCVFICNADDKPVASCLIWRSYELINTVGWFRVLPEYEGKGLGRALLSIVFKDTQTPIYLHTQPTSMRAIKLYLDFGFKLITDPVIGHRKNDLDENLKLFYTILPKDNFLAVQYTKADDALLKAALSREFSEF